MRLRRRPQTHGRFGGPLIAIGYASTHPAGRVPIAYMVEGATREDAEYVRDWLRAMQTHGHSADAFIDHQRTGARR